MCINNDKRTNGRRALLGHMQTISHDLNIVINYLIDYKKPDSTLPQSDSPAVRLSTKHRSVQIASYPAVSFDV